MEPTNSVQKNVTKGSKTVLWVTTGVVATLVLTSVAFGAYIFASNSSKDKEVKDLKSTISDLRAEVDGLKATGTVTPTVSVTTTLKQYVDTDLLIRFSYSSDLTVKPGTPISGKIEGTSVDYGIFKDIIVSDSYGNTLKFYKDGNFIECEEPGLVLSDIQKSSFSSKLSGGRTLYRYGNEYIILSSSQINDGDSICKNTGTGINSVRTQLTVKDSTKLTSFDDLMKTFEATNAQ